MQEKNNYSRPKVSVCIPAYNRKQYLREAIKSVLNQSYDNLELIISDDCSTEDLQSVAREFSDSRIIYFRQEKNLGFVGNWNFCVSQCSGDFIKIMGDDDVLMSNCLETSVDFMMSNPDCGFFCSNYYTIDGLGNIIDDEYFNLQTFRLLDGSGVLEGRQLMRLYFVGQIRLGLPAAIIFKKSILDQVGKFTSKTGSSADIEMWLRMARVTNLFYDDEPLLKMRWHTDNLSKKLKKSFFSVGGDLLILHDNLKWLKLSFVDRAIVIARYGKRIFLNFIDRRILQKSNLILIIVQLVKLIKIIFIKNGNS